jgi:hypothetical protein
VLAAQSQVIEWVATFSKACDARCLIRVSTTRCCAATLASIFFQSEAAFIQRDDGKVEDLSEAVTGWINGYVCTAAKSKCKRIAGTILNIIRGWRSPTSQGRAPEPHCHVGSIRRNHLGKGPSLNRGFWKPLMYIAPS